MFKHDSPYHPRFIPTWIGLAILRLLVILLPYTLLQKLGLALGRFLNKVLPKRRHIVEVNAQLCFPEQTPSERAQFVEDVMANIALGVLETAYSWWASDKDILKRSRVEGLDILNQYLDQGRGVILIGAHFSTLDLSGRVMGVRQKVDITYKNQGNLAFDQVMFNARQRHFRQLIEKQEMRTMLRNLKKGGCVWYAPDQDFGRSGAVFAPFFGVEAATITTLTKLVKITGAKVLFFSHIRHGSGNDTEYVGTVLDPYDENFGDDDLANATLLNKSLEDVLREEDPAQYMWVHKRFRTRPTREEPNPYS